MLVSACAGLALAVCFFVAPLHAEDAIPGKVAATGISVRGDAASTQVAIELTAPIDVTAGVLLNPNRMTLDLPNTVFHAGMASAAKGQGIVAGYRFGMFMAGTSRIVLDLVAPARVESVQTVTGPAGARLIVKLAPVAVSEFEMAARAAETRGATSRREAAAKTGPDIKIGSTPSLPLVVIDPGHGGIDPGAGAGKSFEKDIVLRFGLMLRDKIAAQGHLRVEMTRSDDTFVALADRVKFARDRGAAFFISIHADTLSEGAGVRGATVYTNAERASDERSARLADKENKADLIAGVDTTEEQSDVADILFDLTRRETRQMSSLFASRLVTNLQRTIRTNKNPLRSAGFRVLRAYDTPSVLLELGYLSNAEDAELLNSLEWREAATTAVADAINRYFGRNAPENGSGESLPAQPGTPDKQL